MSNFLEASREQLCNTPLPLKEILTNSLYYPACGFDGGVIKDNFKQNRAANVVSFVYADCGMPKEYFEQNQSGFRGYDVLFSREIMREELVPKGWKPVLSPGVSLSNYEKYQSRCQSFCYWTVYRRTAEFTESHGPERFSFVYIGGEGVATYQALYWFNGCTARSLAIIQPGTGFGWNWTDFRKEGQALGWVINQNPAGKPEWIYYGGIGIGYDDLNWSGYFQTREIQPYYHPALGKVTIWQLANE